MTDVCPHVWLQPGFDHCKSCEFGCPLGEVLRFLDKVLSRPHQAVCCLHGIIFQSHATLPHTSMCTWNALPEDEFPHGCLQPEATGVRGALGHRDFQLCLSTGNRIRDFFSIFLTWGFQGHFLKRTVLVPYCEGHVPLRPLMNCDSAVIPYSNNITEKTSVGMLPSSVCSNTILFIF